MMLFKDGPEGYGRNISIFAAIKDLQSHKLGALRESHDLFSAEILIANILIVCCLDDVVRQVKRIS